MYVMCTRAFIDRTVIYPKELYSLWQDDHLVADSMGPAFVILIDAAEIGDAAEIWVVLWTRVVLLNLLCLTCFAAAAFDHCQTPQKNPWWSCQAMH